MKSILMALGCLISLHGTVYAEVLCPTADLIEENILTFSGAKPDKTKEGKITLNGQTWNFESELRTPEIYSSKSLNKKISDIDLHTCNYLIYPLDTNMEDASLLLHQRPTGRHH